MTEFSPPSARSGRDEHALLERLANVHLAEDQISNGGCPIVEPIQRKWHNVGARSAGEAVKRWLDEQRVLAGLRELAAAPAMDLSLRHALIDFDHRCASGGGIPGATPSNDREKPSASKASSLTASRESGAETVGGDLFPVSQAAPLTPCVSTESATPPAREVGGGCSFDVGGPV